MLVTQDSFGYLKTLCMSILSLVVALESEWKRYSSSQSDKKMLALEYEFSLSVILNQNVAQRVCECQMGMLIKSIHLKITLHVEDLG